MCQYKSLSNVIAASLLLVSFAGSTSSAVSASSTADHGPASIANRQSPISTLLFVPNHGQWPEEVRFQLRGLGGTWWFTDDSVWLTVVRPSVNGYETDKQITPARDPHPFIRYPSVDRSSGVALRLTIPGLSPAARLVPSDEQPSKMNYLLGNDATKWRSNVTTFATLRWESVLPGVDVEFAGDGWRVSGENAARLRVTVDGADSLHTDDRGWLVAETAAGSVPLPFSAAAIDGNAVSLHSHSSPNFQSSIPTRQSPTDDPADLLYSTFLGGSSLEGGGIALGPDGSIYLAGETWSSDFPITPGVFDPSYNGADDIFVSRLSADGSSLVFSTYLGGSYNDYSRGLAIGLDGTAYAVGSTASYDFPTTPGAFDRDCTLCGEDEFGDITDIFVTRLSADGSRLVYSTLLGGPVGATDWGNAIAVGPNGTATLTGWSLGTQYPVTPGAYDTTGNGSFNVVITRLNPNGSGLVYSTYLGGTQDNIAVSLALGTDGSATITGFTDSPDFPVTPGAFDQTYHGEDDTFVSRLSADGSSLVYSTYLGGADYDDGGDLALGVDGAAYVTGDTYSSDFPVTPGAFDTTFAGGAADAFVTKLSPDGSSLVYSTFLGGTRYECPYQNCGIAVGADGSAYLSGGTSSADFPTTTSAYDTTYNGSACGYPCYDSFVSRLTPDGSGLLYSTFLGGSADDCLNTGLCILALGPDGTAYVAGLTGSSDFPTTPGAFDTSFNGFEDVFITRLNPDLPTMHISSITPRYRPAGQGYRIGVEVAVVDDAGNPVVGARVTLRIDLPNGGQAQASGLTGAQGHYSLFGRTQQPGTYTFTVTSVSKAGLVYASLQNVETSDSITIP